MSKSWNDGKREFRKFGEIKNQKQEKDFRRVREETRSLKQFTFDQNLVKR